MFLFRYYALELSDDCPLMLYSFCFLCFKITVCSNYLTIQDEVNQVVIHELIHAYDECRAKNLDWTNCAHHACSEVIKMLIIKSFIMSS